MAYIGRQEMQNRRRGLSTSYSYNYTYSPWHVTAAFNKTSGVVPSRKELASATRLMVANIKTLARNEKVKITIDEKNKSLGIVDVSCDDEDFMKKVGRLARVARIERETFKETIDNYAHLKR